MVGSPLKKKGAGIAFVLPESRKEAAAAEAGNAAAGSEAPGSAAPALPRAMPRTGVGLLATSVFEANKLEQRIESLEGEVRKLEGERGAQLLDARLVAPSRWANRHEHSLTGPEFQDLKREIESAGGNVQPIKVRPLPAATSGMKYEVVFGHRRHRACLELGLPVLAVVQELSDAQLFTEMERENRNRAGLSAWEQGCMYLRALDDKLFPSQRQLAAAIGRDVADVGKALRIAQLPAEVVGAFASPTLIQFRWASELHRALQKDGDAVLRAARELAEQQPRPGAVEVFKALTACLSATPVGRSYPPVRHVEFGPGRSATLRVDARGRLRVETSPGLMSPERLEEVETALRRIFG